MLHYGLLILTHDPGSVTARAKPKTPPKSLSSQCDSTGLKRHWWLVVQTWTFLPPRGQQIDSASWQSRGECTSQTVLGLSVVNRLPELRIIMRSAACLWILKLGLEPISSPRNRLTTKNGAWLIWKSEGKASPSSDEEEAGRCTPRRMALFLFYFIWSEKSKCRELTKRNREWG